MVVKINGDYEVRIKEEDIVVKDKKLYNLTTKKYEAADGDIVEFITEKNGVRTWHRGYVDGYTYGDKIPFRGVDRSEYHNITYKKIEHICLGILVGAAFISVAVMIILTVTPVKRTSKAATYDLECVAGRSRNPLQSCKESK